MQELNQNYMAQKDMTEMIDACFQKPQEDEQGQMLSNTTILGILTREYPSLKTMTGTKVKLGLAMKELGFEQSRPHNVAHYRVIPKVSTIVQREAA